MNSMKDFFGDNLAPYPASPGHQRHSSTSRDAARSMRPHFNAQQQKILDFLKPLGVYGATYNEICTGTGLGSPSVCGRMVELCDGKHVTKSALTRPTPSGRQARVYVFADQPAGASK